MSTIKHRTVLITGGAAGIGKLLGQRLLKEGASQLIIWDINAEALQQTVQQLELEGHNIIGQVVDVSDTEQIIQAVQFLQSQDVQVDILINNAGIVVGNKLFWEHSHRDIDRTMHINTEALMHLTLELLPGMLERNRGHIVNVASAAGLVSNPRMSVYAASKWAVIGWSDSLRLELEQQGTRVKVTTVTPYYINTGMFEGVSSPLLPIIEPEEMVEAIVEGIRQDHIFVRKPNLVNALPLINGLLPQRIFDFVVGDLMGIYKSMDTFKGHKQPKPSEEKTESL